MSVFSVAAVAIATATAAAVEAALAKISANLFVGVVSFLAAVSFSAASGFCGVCVCLAPRRPSPKWLYGRWTTATRPQTRPHASFHFLSMKPHRAPLSAQENNLGHIVNKMGWQERVDIDITTDKSPRLPPTLYLR
jgi:hypothetical protein